MLTLRRFLPADLPEYAAWYADDWLDNALGPVPDAEWLECVMSDEGGIQFAVERDGALIAVAGVCLGTTVHPYYYLTDLAIQPALRRSGLGAEVLRSLCSLSELAQWPSWRAGVSPDNPGALRFFTQLGWVELPAGEGDELIEIALAPHEDAPRSGCAF
ncbi:GNAT family N-acetyltransferase [Chitinibacteraceae bacterium HSL-7]